jgi:hypothetical protein
MYWLIVRVGNNHESTNVGMVEMEAADDYREPIYYCWPAAFTEVQAAREFGRWKDTTYDDSDAFFICARLAEDCDLHPDTGTPPRTPVYQASPRWTSRSTSSMSGRSESLEN